MCTEIRSILLVRGNDAVDVLRALDLDELDCIVGFNLLFPLHVNNRATYTHLLS